MSQLKKAIERVGRRESGPLGFGQFARARRRAMLLAVVAANEREAAAAAEAGADIVIAASADANAAKKAVQAAGGDRFPVGVIVERLDRASAGGLAEAGVDFIVSPFATTAATAVDSGRSGHVISLSDEPDDTTLRALGPIGLDALLVDRGPDELTLERQARLVRLAQLTATPLLFRVDPAIDVDELRVLRDSGGAAVVLPQGTSAADVAGVISRLEEVPEPHRRDRESPGVAMLPALLGHGHEHEEDDEPDIE